MNNKTAVERAFEMAREGDCASIQQLEVKLSKEGYSSVVAHLSSPTLRKQLRKIAKEAYLAKHATASGHRFR